MGLDTLKANTVTPAEWHNFNTSTDVMQLNEVRIGPNPPADATPAPATSSNTDNSGVEINFAPGANRDAVTAHTRRVLQEIMVASHNPSIRITSTQRTPEQQANVMFDNIARPGGVARNLRLYGTAGDQVVRVAATGLNNGLSEKR